MERGSTLIELMITVGIIGILIAIALPAYRNYMQRAANNACLAEAKGYINSVVANFADNITVPVYQATACENFGVIPTVTHYTTNGWVIFNTPLKGNILLRQHVRCQVGTANCQLIP